MSSSSSNSRRSQMPGNQPPRLQRQDAIIGAFNQPQAIAEEAARLRDISNEVIANFRTAGNPAVRNQATATSDRNNSIESMNASLDAIRGTANAEPVPRPVRTARQLANGSGRIPLQVLLRSHPERLRNPEDGIINPAPLYTALPAEGEITMELSVPEPEYTPPYAPFGQGQKRKREREVENQEEEGDVEGEDCGFDRSCAPSPE